MKRNYDTIAFFYDRLARMVYGKALVHAQRYLINAIPPASTVVIAGGGTGWILEEIAHIHPSGLTITYIDASAKMITLAQKRNAGGNNVTFITSPIENAELNSLFDVVITPFLLDNFTNSSLQKVFSLIDGHMTSRGIWLYCDFQNTTVFWQKAMLRTMYLFFRSFCGIEARRLPDAEACFAQYHYTAAKQQTFLDGFIVSVVYEKNEKAVDAADFLMLQLMREEKNGETISADEFRKEIKKWK